MSSARKSNHYKRPQLTKPAWMKAAEDLEAGRITPEQVPERERSLVIKLVENTRALIDHHAERVLRGRTRDERQRIFHTVPKNIQPKVERRVWQLWQERKARATNDNQPSTIQNTY